VGGSDIGNLSLSTPFLRRVRNSQLSSPLQGNADTDGACHHPAADSQKGCGHRRQACRKSRCAFEADMAALRVRSDAAWHTTHEAIFRAMDALLRATVPPRERAVGPKSLLAMCLRQVPTYIVELEKVYHAEAEEEGTSAFEATSRASFEAYSALEERGPYEGWSHLRVVVRAHGYTILAGAISQGLVDHHFSALLVKLAAQYTPLTQCESLVNAHVMRQYPSPSGVDDSMAHSPMLFPLQVLFIDSSHKAMGPMGLAKMTELLSTRLLPAEWLLTRDFGNIWTSAARELARQNCSQAAIEFISVSIGGLCRLISLRRKSGSACTETTESAKRTLISALSALASIVLLGRDVAVVSPLHARHGSSGSAIINRRAETILQSCSQDLHSGRASDGKRLCAYLVALCSFLSLNTAKSSDTISDVWRNLGEQVRSEAWTEHYDATISLLCSVAHCCSRGTTVAPNVYCTTLCDKLEPLKITGEPFKKLHMDGAFRLAEQTSDLRDLLYAEALGAESQPKPETDTASDNNARQTPLKKTTFYGYRWDEGISEWVTATPLPATLLAVALAPATERGSGTRGSRSGSTPCSSPVKTRSLTISPDIRHGAKTAKAPELEMEFDFVEDVDTKSASGRVEDELVLRHRLFAGEPPARSDSSSDEETEEADGEDEENDEDEDQYEANGNVASFRGKQRRHGSLLIVNERQHAQEKNKSRTAARPRRTRSQGRPMHETVEAARDELSAESAGQENTMCHGDGRRAAKHSGSTWAPGEKGKSRHTKQSMQSRRQPLRRISNEHFLLAGSSDDELGL
jgi:hypothetical protein